MASLSDDLNLTPFLVGNRLWGDDFNDAEIANWHAVEREAYAGLGQPGPQDPGKYTYHELNRFHGFRQLPDREFAHALGLGSAWAEEFAPIADRIRRLTIIESSEGYRRSVVRGIPTRYEAPKPSGDIAFDDGEFDLITAFGVLHHIPNVSHVLGELRRCLSSDGFALIREPIVSMGDWRSPRQGMTPNERGIPVQLFRRMLEDSGFRIVREGLCEFSATMAVGRMLGFFPFTRKPAVVIDAIASWLFRWHVPYHATNRIAKVRPTSVFYVLSPDPADL